MVTVQPSAIGVPGVTGPIGLLDKNTTGTSGGNGLASTVVVAVLVPLTFLHVKVYVYVLADVSGPVLSGPEVDCAPPQSPLAVQEVGLLVTLQVRVELSPT